MFVCIVFKVEIVNADSVGLNRYLVLFENAMKFDDKIVGGGKKYPLALIGLNTE